MSRLVMMGVVAVVFVVVSECCDAVCPRGQPPPSPSLGLPSESCQDHICPRPVGLPAPPLPSPSSLGDTRVCTCTQTHTHTHILPLMRVLLFDVKSGSLAGSLYLGERGRLVPWGGKEGQGMPGEELRVTITPALSRNSFFSPIPGSHPHPPKRWPLFTVRTRSLCLRFLKYKL